MSRIPFDPGRQYLEDAIFSMRKLKQQGEDALAQVTDEQLGVAPDPESNSLAVLIQHLSGNMISRWTDFLTSDGEKPDRDRDAEFEPPARPGRASLMKRWDEGWDRAFRALEPLGPEDLGRIVLIRREEHTVLLAIQRQLTHYAYHVGQIVYLAKHLRGPEWKTLS